MNSASRYWYWVRLNTGGQRQVEEIPTAKAFFQEQFPQLINSEEVPDTAIQGQLIDLITLPPTEDSPTFQGAESCLRCFISQQIDRTCLELEQRFGEVGGFQQIDLLPFVLDDFKLLPSSQPQPDTNYESLADKILQTFNPKRSQLSTWTARLVKSHSELNRFLWECGVYLQSDWSILNNYHPKQLQRLLREFYNYNSKAAQEAAEILESYQTVYLSDRLQQNRSRSRCQPPTLEQLNRILTHLVEKEITGYTADELLEQFVYLSELIRRSRQPQREPLCDDNSVSPPTDEVETQIQEFLQRYRQLLVTQLDQAILQVLNDRLSYLKKRKPPKDQNFLQALQLYCQSQPMSKIAREVGLNRQYQVSRLLNLKPLRQDIKQRLLITLKERVIELAHYYTNLTELGCLERALNEEIDKIMKEAERESLSSNCSRESLLNRRLCRLIESNSKA